MRGVMVAIDLESTGLDHTQDKIIEVGAVKIKDGKIIDEFSTLVDPGIPIPSHISHITGIRTEDVAGAPKIDQVLSQIVAFVGDSPLIAHNISLDMGFLQQRYKILLNSQRIDTYEIATILLPQAERYNLHSLTETLNIELDNAHRALDDARATALLYWELWKKLCEFPYDLLQEIVTLAKGLNWDLTQLFELALKTTTNHSKSTPTIKSPWKTDAAPLQPQNEATELSLNLVEEYLGEDGVLARDLTSFEYRQQQIEVGQAVLNALNQHEHVMIEAGTGTGKSMAYLLSAALWAIEHQTPIVISTNTINLQDQLINHDIPLIRQVIGKEIRATVLKGRANYLCPRRLETLRRRHPTSLEELRTVAKILVWLHGGTSGDRGEISLRGNVEYSVWQRLSAADEGCRLYECSALQGGECPFYKARKAAETSHLIIVNHALLISDAASENSVIPQYKHLIVDEAHHLEDAITNGMTFQLNRTDIIRRLADLGDLRSGMLGDILNSVRHYASDKEIMRLESFIDSIAEVSSVMRTHVNRYFEGLRDFIRELHQPRASEYLSYVRVTQQQQSKPEFSIMREYWHALSEFIVVVGDAMQRLSTALEKLSHYNIPRWNDFIFSTQTASAYFNDVNERLSKFMDLKTHHNIYWLKMGQGANETPSINIAPLHVGSLMDEYIWKSKDTVVLTSATLRTEDNFDFLQQRFDAEHVKTFEVGSPFDYQRSTLLYLPQDIPEPSERRAYQQAIERSIIELAAGLDGRVLVLFTSYSQLRETSQNITPRLALGGISVFDQSAGSSRQNLIEGFKGTDKAVLLGTRSFWEGIDIPGESLSALIITRLPFSVPNDPIFSARSETYNNGFFEYALPDAILRFRQGFGRLIRHRTDRGIVVVLDRRIVSKKYGAMFLQSLPNCTLQYGSIDGMANSAIEWLEK